MATFTLAVLLLLGTPGPGVLSLAGLGAAFGFRRGLRFLAGLWIGHNLVSLLVIAGLAALLLEAPRLRTALALAACAYLLWIALTIALAGRRFGFIEQQNAPGFRGGLALQAINPKAYAVSTTVFVTFPALVAHPTLEIALKLAIFNVVWLSTHTSWLGLGAGLKRLDLSERAQRRVNLVLAASLTTVVALAAASVVTN